MTRHSPLIELTIEGLDGGDGRLRPGAAQAWALVVGR